jgi:two-component system, chemotaxis family, sensor histidine kinase and response regulator PixL
MDNENRIPLKFLDEAEDCCDRIESTVLGLADRVPDPQELDRALRAAHSVKGSAAMMGFIPLSQVAHQLEDFFKILRVRYHSKVISTDVETLLLQGVDCLRQVSDLHRQGAVVDENWFNTRSQPIFDRLRQHLGELRPEDEDALLSQEGDIDPAILLFESGVKEAVDLLDRQLARLSPMDLLRELQVTADELCDFGRMAKLDRFVDLCQSVINQMRTIDPALAGQLVDRAIKAWRRSHSLVLLGRFDGIPDRLPQLQNAPDKLELDRCNPAADMTGITDLHPIDLPELQFELANLDEIRSQGKSEFSPIDVTASFSMPMPNWDEIDRRVPTELLSELAAFDLAELSSVDISNWDERAIAPQDDRVPSELLSELANLEVTASFSVPVSNWDDNERPDLNDFSIADRPPLELLAELAAFELPLPSDVAIDRPDLAVQSDVDYAPQTQPPLELLAELANFATDELPAIEDRDAPTLQPTIERVKLVSDRNSSPSPAVTPANSQTVRVPVEYLQQLNTVFGQLILERNAIDLRLDEIHNYTGLLRKRMKYLEASNHELRQWYDLASTEGLIPATVDPHAPASTPGNSIAPTASPQGFDLLEMDRYNDLHLVSQHQIETIVQLQEVTADIELSLQEMTQSVRSLDRTTRTLQSNLTRTQTIPFADVVKRFPRTIRDLSVQFDKPVTLKIVGENIGIDRAILENLSDPLLHLLRNAFDHGIEDTQTRLVSGKPAHGTIVLAASQRSDEIVITISDDGGGIDLDRIRDRLQQMGLSSDEVAKMPEAQLLDAIFEPGFSTAKDLTELSGRGVGMDIVRTNIDRIRGNIRIDTQPGVGTSFILRVPFILSIAKVMLLERAGFVFAVSVDNIKETIRFQPDLATADGTKFLWQSQEIPLIALERGISFGRTHRPFELPGTPTISHPTVLIVGDDRSTTAFHIDRFWGEREVTLRSIDRPMPMTPGFGNSIILGDGRVVPLVDLIQLAEWLTATFSSSPEIFSPAGGVANMGKDRSPTDTILVIDDSINVRRFLAAMLEKEGYQVEQASDGRDAVDKLLGGLVVHAAICDIEMPRLDGYGVLEALRSHEDFEELPILMLTSRNSEKHRMLAMNLGASAYFSKPYTEPELLGTLKSLVKTAKSR